MRGSADLHTCMTTVETKLQISKCSATLISPYTNEMESLLKQHSSMRSRSERRVGSTPFTSTAHSAA